MAFGDLKVQDLIYEDSSNNEITVVIADLVTKNNPSFTGNATGVNLTLSGNLTVNGTTTTIDTTTLQVEDKNIEIGKVSSPSDTTADGGGWSLLGSTTKTFNWVNATDAWTSSENIQVASGKTFIGDGSTLTTLNASNLASGTVAIARLGTGTPDNTKYLRGDGAWTDFSSSFASVGGGTFAGSWRWQASDNSVYVETSPSHKSLKFKDNAAAAFGESTNGDLVIYHNGSHSYIEDRGTGHLIIKTSELDVMNAAGNEDMIKATEDGSVELYENNVKRLETTTTGINVIGAINVNGTALSSAPTITATASGTIAANGAVNLKSDGKVQAVTAVSAGTTESLAGATDPNEEWHRTRWTYDTERKKIIHWWRDESNGDFECRVGTPSGSAASASVSWSSIIDTGFNIVHFDAYFDPQSKRHLIVYHDSSNIKLRAIQLNSNGTLTVGSEYSFASNAANGGQQVTATRAYGTSGTATRQILIVYRYNSGSRKPYFGFCKVNSDNTISNINSDNQMPGQNSSSWGNYASRWDHNNEVAVFVATNGQNDQLRMSWHRGKYDDQKGATNVHTGGYNGMPIPIDESNAIGVCYRDNSDSGKLKLRIGTWSTSSGDEASSVSFSSEYELTSTAATVGSGWGTWVARDEETNRYYFAYTKTSNSTSYLKYFTVDASNSVSIESGDGLLIKNNDIFRGSEVIYTEDLKQMMVGCVIDTNSSDYESAAFIAYGDTTSATNDNFIGFSSAAYSDGDTATINVVGNTTTQSSLTPASTYYVQHNGSLATTPANPSIVAGKALSSTKLLIKG